MPFYEYECQACKFYIEVMQKISAAPLTKCPSCGKRKLKKLVSAPVFRLKGGGWYETDFKGDSEKKRNLVGADKDEAKVESKPETKAEAKPEAKDAKPAAKEAKEAKESKPAPEKAAAGKARATTTRNVRAKPKKTAARKARR
jgi:putative FmdB family regulatory protein